MTSEEALGLKEGDWMEANRSFRYKIGVIHGILRGDRYCIKFNDLANPDKRIKEHLLQAFDREHDGMFLISRERGQIEADFEGRQKAKVNWYGLFDRIPVPQL